MRYILVQTPHKVVTFIVARWIRVQRPLGSRLPELATTVPSRTDPIYGRFGCWFYIQIGFVIKSNQSNQNIIAPREGRPSPSSSFPHIFHPKLILQLLGMLSMGFVCHRIYCLSFIWELDSVKESLIVVADYSLWFLLENEGTRRERDLSIFFFNRGCWT